MPTCLAVSSEAITSRSLMVSSSISSRLTLMSPAITSPRSSTRSRMSPRLAGCWPPPRAEPPAAPDEVLTKFDEVISRFLTAVTAAAGIPPDPAVRHKLAVCVDGGLVGREDIGGGGNPPILNNLDADRPAVFRSLHVGDAFDLFRGELRDLAERGLGRLTGGEGRLVPARGTLVPAGRPPSA